VLRAGARVLTAHATIGYETWFAHSGDDVTGRLLNNTALAFTPALSDPRSPGLTVGAGLQGALTETLALGVEYRGAFGEGGSRRHGAMGTLSYRF
jgi:opacity protein-like surface antigen